MYQLPRNNKLIDDPTHPSLHYSPSPHSPHHRDTPTPTQTTSPFAIHLPQSLNFENELVTCGRRADHGWRAPRPTSRVSAFFVIFLITVEPRVEWYKSLWALNPSSPCNRFAIPRECLFVLITLEPRLEWHKRLWAFNTSPPRNRLTILPRECIRTGIARCRVSWLQGYLAHKKRPHPLGQPNGPRHRPTLGS